MDPKVKTALQDNHKANSMFMSAVGSMLRVIEELNRGVKVSKIDDMRETVIERLAEMLEEGNVDLTCWPLVSSEMMYDDYLKMRERNETLTEYDMIRQGLVEANFSTLLAYFDHYQRVSEKKKEMSEGGVAQGKICSKCGHDKPASSYKRGAVCNTCRSRLYRERVRGAEAE